MAKIKLTKQEFSRFRKRELPLRFYLDVGMPRVADYLRGQGFDTAIAENSRGAAAHDHQHLQQAKDEFRIFVTKDIERVRKESTRLTNCPGIVGVHTSNPTQDEIIEAMQSVLWLSRKWKDFYERAWIISHDNLNIYEVDGQKRVFSLGKVQ